MTRLDLRQKNLEVDLDFNSSYSWLKSDLSSFTQKNLRNSTVRLGLVVSDSVIDSRFHALTWDFGLDSILLCFHLRSDSELTCFELGLDWRLAVLIWDLPYLTWDLTLKVFLDLRLDLKLTCFDLGLDLGLVFYDLGLDYRLTCHDFGLDSILPCFDLGSDSERIALTWDLNLDLKTLKDLRPAKQWLVGYHSNWWKQK